MMLIYGFIIVNGTDGLLYDRIKKHLGDVQKVVVVTKCTPFNHGSVAT